MARFDNKVVLVSGGARGQGAAEARLLVAQGAKVVIGDVLDNQGQSLAVELGPAASFVRHDVTSEADWARAVEAAEKLGGLHGLVNNAGIYQPAALMETDDALWQRLAQMSPEERGRYALELAERARRRLVEAGVIIEHEPEPAPDDQPEAEPEERGHGC